MGKMHRKLKRHAKRKQAQKASATPSEQEPVRRLMNRAERRRHLQASREARLLSEARDWPIDPHRGVIMF